MYLQEAFVTLPQSKWRGRMKIGVPKEIKVLEYRVGMVPAGVRELVHDGHEVFVVERDLGLLALFAGPVLLRAHGHGDLEAAVLDAHAVLVEAADAIVRVLPVSHAPAPPRAAPSTVVSHRPPVV